MWMKDKQKYNVLVWQHQGETTKLKTILQQDMGVSVRFLYGIKKGFGVQVDGITKKFHEPVNNGQKIEIRLPDEENNYPAELMTIPVLYEDEDLLVVEKFPYTVVHPTKGYSSNTLLNGLINLFREKKIKSKIRFINRLDRDTSGILIIAKNSYCHSIMVKDENIKSMKKIYFALIDGHMDKMEGIIDLPIGISEDGIKRQIHEDGQNAVTKYKVIETYKDAQLVELELRTGRTHQIRVHLSHLGHPILGDELYGGKMENIKRQALHCSKLQFHSPRIENKITISTKLPQDMRELIDILSNKRRAEN